jgi:hypothetical protein
MNAEIEREKSSLNEIFVVINGNGIILPITSL